jgi:aminoglycoside N3'-acetyltransferase
MVRRIGFVVTLLLWSTIGTANALAPAPRIDGIKINSGQSLIHLGSLDSFDITESGKRAAQHVLNALEKKDLVSAKAAISRRG